MPALPDSATFPSWEAFMVEYRRAVYDRRMYPVEAREHVSWIYGFGTFAALLADKNCYWRGRELEPLWIREWEPGRDR